MLPEEYLDERSKVLIDYLFCVIYPFINMQFMISLLKTVQNINTHHQPMHLYKHPFGHTLLFLLHFFMILESIITTIHWLMFKLSTNVNHIIIIPNYFLDIF